MEHLEDRLLDCSLAQALSWIHEQRKLLEISILKQEGKTADALFPFVALVMLRLLRLFHWLLLLLPLRLVGRLLLLSRRREGRDPALCSLRSFCRSLSYIGRRSDLKLNTAFTPALNHACASG